MTTGTSKLMKKKHSLLWFCGDENNNKSVLLAVAPVLQAVEAVSETLGLHALSVT